MIKATSHIVRTVAYNMDIVLAWGSVSLISVTTTYDERNEPVIYPVCIPKMYRCIENVLCLHAIFFGSIVITPIYARKKLTVDSFFFNTLDEKNSIVAINILHYNVDQQGYLVKCKWTYAHLDNDRARSQLAMYY